MAANLFAPHPIVDARNPSARQVILDGAIEGHVLVKNTNNALPFKSPKMLSLYGYDAKSPDIYTPSPGSSTFWALALESDADPAQAVYALEGIASSLPIAQIAENGTIISGGGSGGVTPSYVSAPFDALSNRCIEDGTVLFWDFTTTGSTSSVDAASDACLVFINAQSTEGSDRSGLHDEFSDALVNNVCDLLGFTSVLLQY